MSSLSSSSLSLSFSSPFFILFSLRQHNPNINKLATFITIKRTKPKVVVFRCASTTSSSSSSSSSVEKKRYWKVGDYPAISESSIPRSGNPKKETTIKNIKKKLDRKNNAKVWANTVTKALSDQIEKKQRLEALQVFEMLKEQHFYQPKEGTYVKLLVLHGKSGQPQHAHQLFDEMLEEGLEPTS